ncbi:MAG: SAM-dependent methyltransferase [Thermodesulfobacteriota bacterium]
MNNQTDPNLLTEKIKAQAVYPKLLTFSAFMELALYHPELGYYSTPRQKIGKRGDYYTSPFVHPAFGEVIANAVLSCCEALGAPVFEIVEAGAGSGLLAGDVLNSIKGKSPGVYEKTKYTVIEKSPIFSRELGALRSLHGDKISVIQEPDALGAGVVTGVFLSNELLDSLPFHRAVWEGGSVREIYVTCRDGELTEIISEPSTPELAGYFEGYDVSPPDGAEVEINLLAGQWMSSVARALKRGFVLTIDYGHLAAELFSPERRKGTMRCFSKHTLNESPYDNIGSQDITAHVDFSNLIRHGDRCGLKTLMYTTQGQFLVDFGVLDILERYAAHKTLGEVEKGKNIAAIKTLFLPSMMGNRFRVLLQSKDIDINPEELYPPSPLKLSPGEVT